MGGHGFGGTSRQEIFDREVTGRIHDGENLGGEVPGFLLALLLKNGVDSGLACFDY